MNGLQQYYQLMSYLVTRKNYRIVYQSANDASTILYNANKMDYGLIGISQEFPQEDFLSQMNFQKQERRIQLNRSAIIVIEEHDALSMTNQAVAVDRNDVIASSAVSATSLPKLQDVFRSWHYDPEDARSIQDLVSEINTSIRKKTAEERSIFSSSRSVWTSAFIAINGIVFFIMHGLMSENSRLLILYLFSKINERIIAGEWWRFITPAFLHADLFHLISNMISLFYLGKMSESIFGSFRFLVIYLSSAIGGVIFSFAFTQSVSIGASGAVFGLMGALLYLAVDNRDLFFRTYGKSLIAILLLNLFVGLGSAQIDIWAHAGGFLVGFFISCVLGSKNSHLKKTKRILFLFCLILTVGIPLWLGFQR